MVEVLNQWSVWLLWNSQLDYDSILNAAKKACDVVKMHQNINTFVR